jgi:transposase-like protein
LGEEGILQELKKALVEKALGAELAHHLGYEKGEKPNRKTGNTRNGHSKKKVKIRKRRDGPSYPSGPQG